MTILRTAISIGFYLVVTSHAAVAGLPVSTEQGFVTVNEATVPLPAGDAYAKFINVSKWWDGRHTFSQKAENLYLEPRAKGWFGEKLPGGGAVRHLAVVYVAPGKVIRLTGGLGPLQGEPVTGVLTVSFLPGTERGTTKIKLVYKVGGFAEGGLKQWAKPVDGVLALQIKRFKDYAGKK